ncbi:major tail protein [Brochothrix thermosphacta]|uniref:Phage tail protein n=1 Tax=Brochothrix thermosphacta TaxID=2756 RepID=A0A2X0QK01_BROTH|nr:major tail protein [Brochothrix thermosphacta]SPP28876.1 conserved hypothetical protein [Brochothrix thermosphacta]
MVALKGFKRAIIGVYDEAGKKVINKFEFTRKDGEGGSVSADISGLAGEQIKLSAGDGDYYVAQAGVGDVKVKLTLMDLSDEIIAAISGHKTEVGGLNAVGSGSVAPYCSLVLESTTLGEKPYFTGFSKGKFTIDSAKMETSETGKINIESDTELEFGAISDENGDSYKYGTGADKFAPMEKYAFPGFDEVADKKLAGK